MCRTLRRRKRAGKIPARKSEAIVTPSGRMCQADFRAGETVETRTDSEGNIVYPPLVRFQSPDGSFMAKFTGIGKQTQGPLNISKILSIGRQK
jgi:hypothetical protein